MSNVNVVWLNGFVLETSNQVLRPIEEHMFSLYGVMAAPGATASLVIVEADF